MTRVNLRSVLKWLGFLSMGFTFFALLGEEARIGEPKVNAVVVYVLISRTNEILIRCGALLPSRRATTVLAF